MLDSNQSRVVEVLKKRFVRIPSKNSFPQFKDLVTGTIHGDTYFLVDFYKNNYKESHLSSGSEITGSYLINCLPMMYGETFKPNDKAITRDGLLNLWMPPALQFSGNVVEINQVHLFNEFLNRWFPVKEEKDYFIWWLAISTRRQDIKVIATPLLRSEHGIGKGFLAETLLAELLGKQAVAICSLKDVVGDFNEIVEGKTCLIIDEVYRSKRSTADHLKAIQGNKTLVLSRKHQAKITIDNYLNLIVTSNDHIPVLLEDGDRRFWVPQFIKHRENQRETSYFINNKLNPWLEKEDGFQLVRDYLEAIDLSAYYPTDPAPMTKSKKELLGHSTESKLVDCLKIIIEDDEIVLIRDIKRELDDDFDYMPSDTQIASSLFQLGCEQSTKRNKRIYITPYGISKGLSTNNSPSELSIYCKALR